MFAIVAAAAVVVAAASAVAVILFTFERKFEFSDKGKEFYINKG